MKRAGTAGDQQRGCVRVPAGPVAGCDLAQSSAALHSSRTASRCAGACAIAIRRCSNSLWITAEEAAGGLLASIVVGVAVAMIFAQWRWLRQTLYPYTILLQTVPIVAIAPLIINWAGAGIFPVTIVTFIICLAPIIANTTQGLISVDENLIHLFLMSSVSRADSVQAAPAQCAAQSLHRHSHFRGHQRDRRHHRRAVRRLDARWRRRTGLCDHLCEQPDGDALPVRAGICGTVLGFRSSLS